MSDPSAAGGGGDAKSGKADSLVREQDRLLPIANISRIMKRALPANAKMSKESKSIVQECVSEFIGFITSEASERLEGDKRKTITGDDLMESLRALGFDAYAGFLDPYLKRYRESAKGGRATPVKRGRKGQKDKGDDDGDDGDGGDDDGGAEDDTAGAAAPAPKPAKSKKLKTSAIAAAAPTATAAAAAAPIASAAIVVPSTPSLGGLLPPTPVIGSLYSAPPTPTKPPPL